MTYGVGGPLMSWNSSPLVGAVIGVGGRRDDVVCGTKEQEDEFATRRSRGDGTTLLLEWRARSYKSHSFTLS